MTEAEPELSGDVELDDRLRRRYLRAGLGQLRELRSDGPRARPFRPDRRSREAAVKVGEGASPWRLYSAAALEALLPRLAPAAGVVCDIGCGPGAHTRYFDGHAGIRYVGVDIARDPAWAQRGPVSRTNFVQSSATAAALRDGCAGLTFSSSTLEHVDDLTAAVGEIARLTPPGGYGVHLVPGVWSIFLNAFHGYRRFSPSSLAALARLADAELVAVWSLGGIASFVLHLVWITWLETGAIYAFLGLAGLSTRLRLPRVGRRMRRGAPLRLYRALLRGAVALDRWLPLAPAGYALVMRRR